MHRIVIKATVFLVMLESDNLTMDVERTEESL